MNKLKKNVVVVFAKKPTMGKTKSRIAMDTSAKFAYDISRTCFKDLLNNIDKADYYDLIVAVDSYEELSWFEKNFSVSGIVINAPQKRSSTINKISQTFNQLLDKKGYGYDAAILIPMDLPFITEEFLVTAFTKLSSCNYVLGPETNGGIYLIGIKAPFKKEVFKNVSLSTSRSFEGLISNCGISNTYKLKYRNDLNTFQDILNARDEIAHNCPSLYELLKSEGYYKPQENLYIDFDSLSICIPTVSAIVERKNGLEKEILLQTRYKPSIDPKYSGMLEIPSGLVNRYEPAQKAVLREVYEETGLRVKIVEQGKEKNYKGKLGRTNAFSPFCCNQQLKNGRAYYGMVFICEPEGGDLKESLRETRNPQWVKLTEVEKIIKNRPERFFPLNIPVLKYYLSSKI